MDKIKSVFTGEQATQIKDKIQQLVLGFVSMKYNVNCNLAISVENTFQAVGFKLETSGDEAYFIISAITCPTGEVEVIVARDYMSLHYQQLALELKAKLDEVFTTVYVTGQVV